MNGLRRLAFTSFAVVVMILLFMHETGSLGEVVTFAFLLGGAVCFGNKVAESSPYGLQHCLMAGGTGVGLCSLVNHSGTITGLADILGLSDKVVLMLVFVILFVALLPAIRRFMEFAKSEVSSHGALRWVNEFAICRCCVILALLGITLQVIFSFSGDIWGDEAWTMVFIAPSYVESVGLIAADVHPPLYYLIVKGAVDVVHALCPGVPAVYVVRMCSVIPVLSLAVIGVTYIRNRYGRLPGTLFAVLVACMAPMIDMSIEMRMYSWALFFVTLTYLFAERLSPKGNMWLWCGFVLFSLGAAYTHYFAIVAVLPAYLYVLVVMRSRIWVLFLVCLIVVACYFPWLLVFINQATRVGAGYWISPVGMQELMRVFGILLPDGFCVAMLLLLLCLALLEDQQKEQKYKGIVCMLVPVFVVLVGWVASLAFRPVFVARYLFPAVGVMWYGAVILLSRYQNRNIVVMFSLCTMFAAACSLITFSTREYRGMLEHERFMTFAQAQVEPIYISIETKGCRVASVMTGCPGYSWKSPLSDLMKKAFGVESLHDVAGLRKAAESGKTVCFLARKPAEIEQFKSEVPFECHYQGKFLIGQEYDVYRVIVD